MQVLSDCIRWADEHLGFIPGATPEEALARAATLVTGTSGSGTDYWKAFWVVRTRAELHLTVHERPTAQQILSVQLAELARLDDGNDLLVGVNAAVDRIVHW